MPNINLETKTDRELLLLTAQQTNEITSDVKDLTKKVTDVCADHNKLKRNFYILVAFLAGTGVLGGGIWALLR